MNNNDTPPQHQQDFVCTRPSLLQDRHRNNDPVAANTWSTTTQQDQRDSLVHLMARGSLLATSSWCNRRGGSVNDTTAPASGTTTFTTFTTTTTLSPLRIPPLPRSASTFPDPNERRRSGIVDGDRRLDRRDLLKVLEEAEAIMEQDDNHVVSLTLWPWSTY